MRRAGGPLQQIFLRFASGYLAKFGERMPLHHRRAMFDIAACRTAAMGGHTDICNDCGVSRFVPHSCRHALCPRCHDTEIDEWLAARAGELLPARYFHLTFPLPAALRDVARRHQHIVCGTMLQAAAESLQTLAKDRLGGRLGIIAILHTWGRSLPWHPHVHCLIPAVVVCPNGKIRKVKVNYLLRVKSLSKVYRAVFLRLVRAHTTELQLPHIEWSKQWIVNCRACDEGPGNVLKYLARYTKRGPLAERNILSITDQQIIFRYNSHQTNRYEQCKLTPEEFLRRYLQHTPPPGFHRIRYYGFLAPGARKTLRAIRIALLSALESLAPIIAELRARCKVVSQRLCSYCGGRSFVQFDFMYPNRRAPPWVSFT